MDLVHFLFRWTHLLFGITWIGMLYYFNFVQGGYFKSATPEGLSDAKAKLAPNALWWFRWGAMFTFITGVYLLYFLGKSANEFILVGGLMGTFMFLNVWLIIWPNQKIALGMVEGNTSEAGKKALLASRTNVLFSAPMAFGMLASSHGNGFTPSYPMINSENISTNIGLLLAIAIIILLEMNGLFGKQGLLATVKGVIHCSLGLTAVLVGSLYYL